MPLTKTSFLFLLFLGSFCRLTAQTDSGALHPLSDTPITAPPHRSGDSGLMVKPRPVHLLTPAKKTDSLSLQASNRKDSTRRAAIPAALSDSVTGAGKVEGAGRGERDLLKPVLARNAYFNFTGKAFTGEMVPHIPDSKELLFYLFIGILFYFALIRMFFEKYYDNLLTLFFRASIRQQQIREQVLQTPLPSLMLNILFVISGGFYAAWLARYYQFATHINFWILLIDCMAALGLIYLGKFLLLKFCGWVFNIARATDTYIFIVFLVNKMMGIFLLPFLVILYFSGPLLRDIFVTISLSMIFLFYVYRVIASFRPVRTEIKLTPFHFFLYLCAFEIAPLLLIYKVLLSYLEKGY